MAMVKYVDHKGKKILLMDYSSSTIEQTLKAIAETKKLVALEDPDAHLLGIVDVSTSTFDTTVTDALKDLATHNKPYMKASAIIGVTGVKKVIFQAVLAFTGRKNLVLKNTVEEAKDWLVSLP